MNLKGNNSRAIVAAVITALVMTAVGGVSAFAGASKKKSAKAPTKVTAKAPSKNKVAGSTTTPPAHDESAEHAAFAQALADKLGVPVADVAAALDSLRPAPGTRPDRSTFPKALADKLGLDEATVKTALEAVRPAHGPDGRGDHHGGPLGPNAAAVAAELGVTEAQLKTALEAIRPAAGTRPDPAAFPQKLADALNIPLASVTAALAKFPHPGDGGPHGDGPHGDGPHGPRGGVDPDGDNWTGANKPAPAAKAAPKVAKRR